MMSAADVHDFPNKKKVPRLGVIRLDYDYPAAPGDIDCADTFGYPVFYKVVPGLTFELCQSGNLPDDVKERFIKSIRWLIEEKDVSCITGDCGFMIYFQRMALKEARKMDSSVTVMMSALIQLKAILIGVSIEQSILIMTANQSSLENVQTAFRKEFGVTFFESRLKFVGCESVEGFEAVAKGKKVDVQKVEPGIIELVRQTLEKYPNVGAIILECTELPPYANGIREVSGLPVFDAITCCDFFMNGFKQERRYGKQGWQHDWDGVQDKYQFGDNVHHSEKHHLVHKPSSGEINGEL
ncbi:uncharacterized protein LOC142351956 [Convolutriloba macropyga]|uniref:uncharacterized protein LOC142351956 n=1 Tax=Convolutriloba macropyga TaxID=536237 RepID=UPI003F528E17